MLDRRAVDVGIQADLPEEHAVGRGHRLAAQLDGAAPPEPVGQQLEALDDARIARTGGRGGGAAEDREPRELVGERLVDGAGGELRLAAHRAAA